MLASAAQQCESAIIIHASPPSVPSPFPSLQSFLPLPPPTPHGHHRAEIPHNLLTRKLKLGTTKATR